ncbi:MAG: hypothetical protein JXR96_06565 [Deltaproteobacteria bacterium]|nr:hypothetical protein [Deltaproteobacteria bacterium]
MMRRIGLASLLVCTVLACGGSDKELLITDFAHDFSAAFCAKLYTCCTDAELEDIQGDNFTDEASCTTVFTTFVGTYIVTPMQSAITAERGEYDAKKAAKCLDEYTGRGCTGSTGDFSSLLDTCEDFYVGLQATDAECASSLECVEGHMCHEDVCKQFLSSGAECTPDGLACDVGLYCDGANCTARKAATESCTSTTECQAGLICLQDECTQPDPVCDGR